MVDTGINPMSPKIVDLNGRQVRGRPILFDRKSVTRDFRDASGEFIKPIKYESMCPFCCLRIEFSADLKSIKCDRCNRGINILTMDKFPNPFCEPGEYDQLEIHSSSESAQ